VEHGVSQLKSAESVVLVSARLMTRAFLLFSNNGQPIMSFREYARNLIIKGLKAKRDASAKLSMTKV